MGQKLVIGPIDKGLKTDRLAFNIDNDSFPTLINSFQWRGRAKRKRGTTTLGQLNRYIGSTNGSGAASVSIVPAPILPGQSFFIIGSYYYVDPDTTGSPDTITLLTNDPSGGTFTLTRSTGALSITGSSGLSMGIYYYSGLPVMGFEELSLNNLEYPGNLSFDTTYSYNVSPTQPYAIYDVSYYKNPILNSTILPGYVRKTTSTPLHWNGENYQQFWTINYQNALWATNGIDQNPITLANIGMQYAPSSYISGVSVTSTTMTLTITFCPLVIGDFVYLNEWVGTTVANSNTLNWQTGYVTACSPNTPGIATKTITITFPNAMIASDTYTPGIVQFLTTSGAPSGGTTVFTKDPIRWYDGDPDNNTFPVTTGTGFGWVNFCPPLVNLPRPSFSIADQDPTKIWYLVGAKIIVPFKDRLLFFGPVIQTSAGDDQTFLEDTVIYSQNGTPYFTNSFQGSVLSPTTITSLLTPNNQNAFPASFFEDQTGFGGFQEAGVSQQITTVSTNEDALIVGFFNNLQTRMIYSGNDIVPFNFYIINAELGSNSTFSAITMDQGVLSRGPRGLISTSQTTCNRFDLEIPDQAFQISNINNGAERFCSARDFINEWVYFTYPSQNNSFIFPNQTLFYNYRDDSWGIFNESYTTYGLFRRQTGFTWLTVPFTWENWNTPWNSGSSDLLEPLVVGGNAQGFLMIRDDSTTEEGLSITIQNIVNNVITSVNHGLSNGDFIFIDGVLNGSSGAISSSVNGKVFQVDSVSTTGFSILPSFVNAGTYGGGGQIKRYYVPDIMTKQFPTAWDIGRKTRIGPQQYLLTYTPNAQITLNMYLSQDSEFPYNLPSDQIVPNSSTNNSIIYSNILYTCPESTNLGLTPANINLQMPSANNQAQIWHRMNTSLIGDTVQFGLTLSDDQMLTFSPTALPTAITGATNEYPCVLTCTANYNVGQMIQISGVLGMTQLNLDESYNYYYVLSSNGTNVTIDIDSSDFGTYVTSPNAIATPVNLVFQEAEVEFHGAIFDVQPSSLLV